MIYFKCIMILIVNKYMRDAMLAQALAVIVVCPSVHPSICHFAKHRIT